MSIVTSGCFKIDWRVLKKVPPEYEGRHVSVTRATAKDILERGDITLTAGASWSGSQTGGPGDDGCTYHFSYSASFTALTAILAADPEQKRFSLCSDVGRAFGAGIVNYIDGDGASATCPDESGFSQISIEFDALQTSFFRDGTDIRLAIFGSGLMGVGTYQNSGPHKFVVPFYVFTGTQESWGELIDVVGYDGVQSAGSPSLNGVSLSAIVAIQPPFYDDYNDVYSLNLQFT